MRARLAAIVLSALVGLGVLIFSASAASAATPMSDASSPGSMAVSAAAVTAGDDAGGESIGGRLQAPIGENDAREPIPGVSLTVSQDGTDIGTGTSDDKGMWRVTVPGPGQYDISIDTSTLPDTVQLRDPDKVSLSDFSVGPGQSKSVIFALVKAGTSADASGSKLPYYASMFVIGLRFGLIIAMTAVGLSLIFGTTGLINFAHGEMVTIGAVVAYVVASSSNFWLFAAAIVVAIIAVAFLGGLFEVGLWRPLRKRGTGLIQMFIISIGLSLLLRYGTLFFFGGNFRPYHQARADHIVKMGQFQFSLRDFILIGFSVAVLLLVALMLQHTRMGKAMRALSDNRDLAEASGIDVQRVTLNVWMLGGGLAALGGVLLGLTTNVQWQMGWYLLLLMFAGVILGGLGSAYGAMLGSIVVGIVAQMSTIWFPADLQNAWALVVLVIVLLVRPQGILGRMQRAG